MLSLLVTEVYQEPVPDSGLPVKLPAGWSDVKERFVREAFSGVVEVGVGVALLTVAAVAATTRRRNLENMVIACGESATGELGRARKIIVSLLSAIEYLYCSPCLYGPL